MDTPSLKSLSLVCKCGARLDYTDETWRIEEAREEFVRVHAGRQSCAVRDLVAEQRTTLEPRGLHPDGGRLMRTANPTLAALYRLKARLGKERARLARFYNEEVRKDRDAGRAVDCFNRHRDRCWYEITICDMAMGMVDHEVRRTKKGED